MRWSKKKSSWWMLPLVSYLGYKEVAHLNQLCFFVYVFVVVVVLVVQNNSFNKSSKMKKGSRSRYKRESLNCFPPFHKQLVESDLLLSWNHILSKTRIKRGSKELKSLWIWCPLGQIKKYVVILNNWSLWPLKIKYTLSTSFKPKFTASYMLIEMAIGYKLWAELCMRGCLLTTSTGLAKKL